MEGAVSAAAETAVTCAAAIESAKAKVATACCFCVFYRSCSSSFLDKVRTQADGTVAVAANKKLHPPASDGWSTGVCVMREDWIDQSLRSAPPRFRTSNAGTSKHDPVVRTVP